MRATARWGIGLVAVAAGWLVASSAARWGMVSHPCAQHPAAAKGRVATDHPGREVPRAGHVRLPLFAGMQPDPAWPLGEWLPAGNGPGALPRLFVADDARKQPTQLDGGR